MTRPQPGTKTTGEIRIEVCQKCGYIVDLGLCQWKCDNDSAHEDGTFFYAVYERTDVFLRDEEVKKE